MRKVTNDKDFLKALKKSKKGETIIYDEARDVFNLSYGNKKVLELIPSMMEDKEYRHKLRDLAITFSFKKGSVGLNKVLKSLSKMHKRRKGK